jgi:hypothetical protein
MNLEQMGLSESEEETEDPVFSEVIEIARGWADTPEFRDGSGAPTPGEFAYDLLCETRILRGDDAAYELAKRIVRELEYDASPSDEANAVLKATHEFLRENEEE